ncbi:hypothetical protein ACVWXO_000554 [Bradyrhizobium sp. LM2.7]
MSPQTKLCAVLRGALEDAVRMVPEAKRTSSLKACLAETISLWPQGANWILLS